MFVYKNEIRMHIHHNHYFLTKKTTSEIWNIKKNETNSDVVEIIIHKSKYRIGGKCVCV